MSTMDKAENLISTIFPIIKRLLIDYKEFYPIGSGIKVDGTIVQIAHYDGNDRPLSLDLFNSLVSDIKDTKEKYSSVAIFYDVVLSDIESGNKTNAVAVFYETKEDDFANIFYYPYELTDTKSISFGESSKEQTNKLIFTD